MVKAYLETDEIESLQKEATNLRDRLLVRILFHLGCRISEALSLGVCDIDFTQGTVRIQHLKTRLKLACKECSASLGRKHTFCPRCGQKVDEAQIHQPGILPLQDPEPFCLLNTHTAVLFAPLVVGLFSDPDLPAGFADVSSLIQQDFNFAQLVHSMVTTSEICSHSVYGCDL